MKRSVTGTHYHIIRLWPQTGQLDIACMDRTPLPDSIELQSPFYIVASPVPHTKYDDCGLKDSRQIIHRISYQNISEQVNHEANIIVKAIMNDAFQDVVTD